MESAYRRPKAFETADSFNNQWDIPAFDSPFFYGNCIVKTCKHSYPQGCQVEKVQFQRVHGKLRFAIHLQKRKIVLNSQGKIGFAESDAKERTN